MKFFFPDSIDQVDPAYDFECEVHPPGRVRQRTDKYAHELLDTAPYDGILVSMAIVSRSHGKGRYTISQAERLKREGAHRFFRAYAAPVPLAMMGDCGAYAYIKEHEPPFSVDDVLDFYEACQFDYVLSLDHVIPGFFVPGRSERRGPSIALIAKWQERQTLTLALAEEFLLEHRARGHASQPIGVAQGWDAGSYGRAIHALEGIGYDYIALGGIGSLPTEDVLSSIEAADAARRPTTRFHVLGASRLEIIDHLPKLGVVSFDTTMPLRQAFMDDKHNYHTSDRAYLAIRVPQVHGNVEMRKRIRNAEVPAHEALRLERLCLDVLRRFDNGEAGMMEALHAVRDYELLFNGRDQTEAYGTLLEDRPWKHCSCVFCQQFGIQIVIFRCKERNKRRGFHNLQVLAQRMELIAA